MHTKWATTGQPAKSSAPLPRRQLVRTGAAPPRGPGSTTPITLRGPGTGLGHPPPAKSSAPLQCCQLAKGRAHWNRAPLARTRGRRRPRHLLRPPPSYPGPRSPRTKGRRRPRHLLLLLAHAQALRLALGGKGPRPVHPANWRRVLDVESRPTRTCDARGRSLGVSPPPSARHCRGTLMGRCVLHKSSQGSG